MIILASASAARRQMLDRAGVALTSCAALVDEAAVKQCARGADNDRALMVAEAKATEVARRHPGALVIGADQMLVCEVVWFDKPASAKEAREQLLALRGRTHRLISAVVVMRDGAVLWRCAEVARLTMRAFSEAFLDQYLAEVGDEVCHTVGCYRIEGVGLQLFSRVEGDHFVILGMPLLPLLEALRGLGELES